MKAMIFAAGRGKRMAELTRGTPKPLLEVAGKPLIEYSVLGLRRAGFGELVINVAYLGEQIQDYLGDGKRYGLDIRYSREPYPLETGGAIARVLPLLGDEPFVVLNADVWTDYPFEQLLGYQFDPDELGHLVMVPNPDQLPGGDFYLNEAQGLQQSSLQQPLQLIKSSATQHCFTYSGVGLLHPRLVADYSRCREKFPLVEAFREAIASQRLTGEVYRGQWRDIGTPERLSELRQEVNTTGR